MMAKSENVCTRPAHGLKQNMVPRIARNFFERLTGFRPFWKRRLGPGDFGSDMGNAQ
jgi:hypothetical protein